MRFSNKMARMAVFALCCLGQSGADACAARLINDYTRDVAHTYFTTTYPNFMQCADILVIKELWRFLGYFKVTHSIREA